MNPQADMLNDLGASLTDDDIAHLRECLRARVSKTRRTTGWGTRT